MIFPNYITKEDRDHIRSLVQEADIRSDKIHIRCKSRDWGSWHEELQELILPVQYDSIPYDKRWEIREAYVAWQEGKCIFCQNDLEDEPHQFVMKHKKFLSIIFSDAFRQHPIHLHHDHKSGFTIGAVHMLCNALLAECGI